MDIINETPFPHELVMGNGPDQQPMFSVVIKGTFSIPEQNKAIVNEAESQSPIALTDEYFDEGIDGSVKIESDMVLFKPKADIVLAGNAYAPLKQPVRVLDTALYVGRIIKNIRVFGDRNWSFPTKLAMVPVISDPKPFLKMPLVYERAFGGVDDKGGKWCKENLIGRGFIGKKSKKCVHEKPLPNLEDPQNLITSWDSHPRPVGFGFYGRGWQPRVSYVGTMDEKWESETAPELPEDFSFNYYNGAHPDLQIPGYLNGDELVQLKHITPNGYCSFRLPGIHPKITVEKYSPRSDGDSSLEINEIDEDLDEIEPIDTYDTTSFKEEIITPKLDTLVLLPDEGIFCQVWRGICPLNDLDISEIKSVNISLG